jgi:hypothetical protein
MPKIITTFFTENAAPREGLTPTITIRELDPTNPANNPIVVNTDSMTEIGQGWYRYTFVGYDSTSNYTFFVDGGAVLPVDERYYVSANESYDDDVKNAVWDAPTADHTTAGTMGFAQGQTSADIQQIRTTDLPALYDLINLVRKYNTNRTRIDPNDNTLTVFDDDCSTVLRVFHLLNSNGLPSSTEVCERAPTTVLNNAANSGAGSTDPSGTCG